jgi:hypothetical protein
MIIKMSTRLLILPQWLQKPTPPTPKRGILFPKRDVYPQAFRRFLVRRMKHYVMFSQCVVTVVETEASDRDWVGLPRIVV